jgi:hypothetical protein
MSTMQRIQT